MLKVWPGNASRLMVTAREYLNVECLDLTSETCIRTSSQYLLARIPFIETLQATYNFDIFGICESSLTGNTSNDDIFISSFSLQPSRSDKSALLRYEGVCLYRKKIYLLRNELTLLDKTIVAEIKIKRKNIFFVLSYRHPNQTLDEVNLYMQNLENIYESIKKENPAATIICGDYNATSTIFWKNDKLGSSHI